MFPRIRSASRLVIGLAMFAVGFLLVGFSPGCQSVDTPHNSFDRGGATLDNPSPVTLHIQDNDKVGTTSGVGPSRWTSITGDEIQTLQTGSTPRDFFLAILPDGTKKFNLSSGTDVVAKGVEINAATGDVKIAEFGTNASEPIRAHNEAFDKLVAYWTSLPQIQKDALVAEMDAAKVIAPTAANMIDAIVKALTGGVAP